MPPKKVKDKQSPEKIYEFLTLEEMKAKEQKLSSHINELSACLNFIDDAISLVSQSDEAQLKLNKWHKFATCFPLPKPYKPADIRLYITKLQHFEYLNIQRTIDWNLSVDERSILTQNIFRKDLSRRMLKNTIKSDFGSEYNENIDNCLKVIQLMRYFLDNDVEVAKCNHNILEDIKLLKSGIQEEINKFFDRYTYRVLCSEDAYMESIDSVTAEYYYSADNFKIHIWCLKNLPIRFASLEEPRLLATFHAINVTLHIPSFMLQQNLCIRAIHQNFDHITEYAKSFSKGITAAIETPYSYIQNLPESLLLERSMELNIQNRVREAMMQKRLEYEEKLRLYEEEVAKKKSKKVEEEKKKKKKLVKPTKEPPVITSDVYPDVWMDFLQEEQEQYEKFINTVYNPESMELKADEINLRKYLILGGIYQFYYVHKPKHWDFDKFNMTWHQDDSKTLVIDRDIEIPHSGQFLERRSTKIFKRLTIRSLSIKEEVEKESTDPECRWFVLTFKLPEYLCYWGEPIACHYETITKVVEKKIKEPPPTPEPVKKKSKKAQAKTTPLEQEFKKESIDVPEPEYYPFLEPRKGESITSVLKIKPSKGDVSKTSLSSLEMEQASYFKDYPARDAYGVLNIKDFELTRSLDKSQVQHITRHLVPRIISSFKFPKELTEDKLQVWRSRPKIKGAKTLVRNQIENEENQHGKIHNILTYSQDQSNPERIFSIYPREELIRIILQLYNKNEDLDSDEPKTFSQLAKMINNIKKKYLLRVRDTLDLPPFKSRINIKKKIIKNRSKLKSKPLVSALATRFSKSSSFSGYKQISTINIIDDNYRETINSLGISSAANAKELNSEMAVLEGKQKLKEKPKICSYSHWTTQHILKSEYDKTKCTISIQTDRLGIIGFAFKRYIHFPFKYWKLEPSETNPENEVIFTLETQYVKCVLCITDNGICGHVTEPTKTFKRNPKMYLIIEKPMKDFTEFKKLFKEKNLNIFAGQDAFFYIENGYFCEKHFACEMHTYNCMALNCTQMKFNFSQWNRLAKRRDIILQFVQFKDVTENTVEARMTPEEAYFVEISELCSDDVDIIKLDYNLTWRNINTCSDLHHLVKSMYPAASDLRLKNPKLITCIRNLLTEIRPLSFS